MRTVAWCTKRKCVRVEKECGCVPPVGDPPFVPLSGRPASSKRLAPDLCSLRFPLFPPTHPAGPFVQQHSAAHRHLVVAVSRLSASSHHSAATSHVLASLGDLITLPPLPASSVQLPTAFPSLHPSIIMPRAQSRSSIRALERLQPSSLGRAATCDEEMPSITFEPPTPLAVDTSVLARQSSPSGQPISATSYPAASACISDGIFAWQEGPSPGSPSESRPASMSGWSLSGTSLSGEEVTADSTSEGTDPRSSAVAKNKSHSKKRAPGHVNRPRNAFILFRSHAIHNNLIPTSLGVKDNRAISCIVASLWKSLPEEEKKQWTSEAQREKELHRLQYPDYQFKPHLNASTAKPRRNAKTLEADKERCEIIADQILRAHGRASVKEEYEGTKARQTRREGTRKAGSPRAAKAAQVKLEELAEQTDYAPPPLTFSRRRSLSVPQPMHHEAVLETNTQPFGSWHAGLDEAGQAEHFTQHGGVGLSQNCLSVTGSRTRPAALDLSSYHARCGDASFMSPRTLSTMVPPLRQFCRPKSASPSASPRQGIFAVGQDAMLLSPMCPTFGDGKRESVGWQRWSRLSAADLALPMMRPRQSVCRASRHGSLMDHVSFVDGNHFHHMTDEHDDLFSQAARAASISLPELPSPLSTCFYQDMHAAVTSSNAVKDEEPDVFHFGHAFLQQAEDVDEEVELLASDDETAGQDGDLNRALSLADGEIVAWDVGDEGSEVGDASLTFDPVFFADAPSH